MGVRMRRNPQRDRAGAVVTTYRVGNHHGVTIVRDRLHAAEVLSEARRARAIHCGDLGRRLGGLSRKVISRWLRGEVDMRASTLFALADALGYDLALIPREDTP